MSYEPVRHSQRPVLTLAGHQSGIHSPTAVDFAYRATLSIHTGCRQHPGGASGAAIVSRLR